MGQIRDENVFPQTILDKFTKLKKPGFFEMLDSLFFQIFRDNC